MDFIATLQIWNWSLEAKLFSIQPVAEPGKKVSLLMSNLYLSVLISLFSLNYMPLLHMTEMCLQYNNKYLRTGSSCKMLPSETKYLYIWEGSFGLLKYISRANPRPPD